MTSHEENTIAVKSSESRIPHKRQSYTREYKLNVVSWFYQNGKGVSVTARKFGIGRKLVRTWVKAESDIKRQKENSKAVGRGRKALFPSVERKLHEEFKAIHGEGKMVKRSWFRDRAKELLKEHEPKETNFKASDRWFSAFCRRHGVSLHRNTHGRENFGATETVAYLSEERMRASQLGPSGAEAIEMHDPAFLRRNTHCSESPEATETTDSSLEEGVTENDLGPIEKKAIETHDHVLLRRNPHCPESSRATAVYVAYFSGGDNASDLVPSENQATNIIFLPTV